MKAVRTLQKYKCDFCQYRSVKHRVEIHEKRCFRNPNRFCDNCENKGYTEESHEGIGTERIPCHYCTQFDRLKLQEIEAREAKEKPLTAEEVKLLDSDVPF